MAKYQSNEAKGTRPVVSINGVSGAIQRIVFPLPKNLALGDVLELFTIPEEAHVVDWSVDADKLDTGGAPALKLDLGILNDTRTDLAAGVHDVWSAGMTVAQTGGLVRAASEKHMRAGTTRTLGFKVSAAPATFAADKVLGITVYLCAA